MKQKFKNWATSLLVFLVVSVMSFVVFVFCIVWAWVLWEIAKFVFGHRIF